MTMLVKHNRRQHTVRLRQGYDATTLWWAMTAIEIGGYGDRYPTTTEGRMVAVLLMSAGVGLFGTFYGSCLVVPWGR
jgi:Ion channel